MEALIYIEVLNELNHDFVKPRFEELKKIYSNHEAIDLDNFSDDKMIEHTKLLIEQTNHLQLVFNIKKQDASLNKILSLFSLIKEHSSKTELHIEGESHRHVKVLQQQVLKTN